MLLGVIAGAALGLIANQLGAGTGWLGTAIAIAHPIGQIFLRLLFVLVIPLLFSALVIGISELDLRHLGRLGLRMLGYTIVVSAIAVAIGVGLVNAVQPGAGMPDEARELAARATAIKPAPAPPGESFAEVIVAMVPDNAIKAAAAGDMIGVILFALIFGVGLATTETAAAARVRELIQGIYDVMMRLIDGVLALAPLGVGALLFTMTAQLGVDILRLLGAYVAVVLVGLGFHMVVVYSLSVKLAGGMSPLRFYRDVRLAMLTAFSTASSSATLPTALKVADENLHLPRHVARFVLTAGSAMNQNGTALFEGVTVLFLAQLFGIPLGLADQAEIMIICVLAGIGTAGVPAGSIPVVAMILARYGIPLEGLGLILGVDRFLDMCRTTLNVTGDLAAAVFVGRGEPADPPTPPAPGAPPHPSPSLAGP
jgi:DAACS family dicarboxylate/amino acid:cation (Na+ or H+) symporter